LCEGRHRARRPGTDRRCRRRHPRWAQAPHDPQGILTYDLSTLPAQNAFEKQARLLAQSLNPPSLHAKEYHEASDLWQAHVNRYWRICFPIRDDAYLIVAIISHPR
jgi:hypothetical protein